MHDYPGVQIAWKRILSIAQNTPDPAAIAYTDGDEEEDVLTTLTPATVTSMQRMGRALQNMYTITSHDEGYLAFIVTVVQELKYNCPIAMTFVKHIIDYSEIPSKATIFRTTQAMISMLINNTPSDNLKINASIVWSLLARKFAGNLAEVMWQDSVAHILIDAILAGSNTGPTAKLFALLALESFAITGGIKKKILNSGSFCIISILGQNLKECQSHLSLSTTHYYQPQFVQQQRSSPSLLSNMTKSPDLTLVSTLEKKYTGKKFYHGWIHKPKFFSRVKLGKNKESKKTSVIIDLADDSSPFKPKNCTPSAIQDSNDEDWYGYMQLQHCLQWSLDNTFAADFFLLPQFPAVKKLQLSPGRVCLSIKNSTKHLKPSGNWLEIRNDTYFLESARATASVDSGRWYYEVFLLTNGVVQIGWGTYKCLFLPEEGCGVGDDSNGFSFDTYQSAIWASSEAIYPQGHEKSSRCKIGDVIGTLLDMDQGLCTFFINGQDLGLVVQFHTNLKKQRSILGLYPTLSLTSHQHVVVNFGDQPWFYEPPVPASSFQAMSEKSSCDSPAVLEKSHKMEELKKEGMEEEHEWDGPLCTLCFSELKQVTLLPCQHDGFGKSCAKILDLCPLCRTKISKRVSTLVKPFPKY